MFDPASAGIAANPFIVLEDAWKNCQDDPSGANHQGSPLPHKHHDFGAHAQDEGGDRQSGFGCYPEGQPRPVPSHAMNLSSMCISTIFQIEDAHLPQPLLKIYAWCLQKAREQPHNEQNITTLKLCNYLFKKWHDTRAELNFIRDTMKIVIAFAQRFNDHAVHLARAIDSCPIGKYRVWITLLQQLKRDARGMSIGDYLSRLEGGSPTDPLGGMTFNLFDYSDAMGDERDGYFACLMKWPSIAYARQVVLHLLRNLYKLSSSFGSRGHPLFEECVPSWAEDRHPNNQNHDPMGNEDRQLRQRIVESLLQVNQPSPSYHDADRGKEQGIKKRRKVEDTFPSTDRAILSADRHDSNKGGAVGRLSSHDEADPVSPMPPTEATKEEEDLMSIGTRSFRHEMRLSTLYVVGADGGEERLIREDAAVHHAGDGYPAVVESDRMVSPTTAIRDNEWKLNQLLDDAAKKPLTGSTKNRDNGRLLPLPAIPYPEDDKEGDLFEKIMMPHPAPSSRITEMIAAESDPDNDDKDSGQATDAEGHSSDDPDYHDSPDDQQDDDGL